MLRLVWKDFAAAGWVLLAWMPLYAIQAASVASIAPALLIITVLSTAGLAFGSIGIEEIQRTEATWCSLPVSRREIVLARYAATATGIALGLGTSWAAALAARWWIFTAPRHAFVPPGAGAYATLLALFLFNAALFLPCYFRLGAGRGVMLFCLLVLALLALGSVLGWLAVQAAGGAEALEALRARDPERIAAAKEWIERWGGFLAGGLAAGAAMLFVASAALSVSFYSRKDI